MEKSKIFNGVSETDYKAFLEACDADDYAHEFEFKRQGMVAFFDVLGYSKLAEDVSEDVIRVVMDALVQARDEAKRLMYEIDKHEIPSLRFVQHDPDEIRTVNISDSIVVIDRFEDVMPFGADGHLLREISDSFCLYQFIQFCRKLWDVLFVRGLPLRGAISTGTFYWNHETIFAGRPFIEAYTTQESLSFSGLVLSKSADVHKRVRLLLDKDCFSSKDLLSQDLCVPTKGSSGDDLTPMDVVIPGLPVLAFENLDDYVESRFKAHGKRIEEQRVKDVLKNTINIMRNAKRMPGHKVGDCVRQGLLCDIR